MFDEKLSFWWNFLRAYVRTWMFLMLIEVSWIVCFDENLLRFLLWNLNIAAGKLKYHRRMGCLLNFLKIDKLYFIKDSISAISHIQNNYSHLKWCNSNLHQIFLTRTFIFFFIIIKHSSSSSHLHQFNSISLK